MKTARVLVREARAAGARIAAVGERVRVWGQVPEDLLRRLREQRDQILEFLRREAATPSNITQSAGGVSTMATPTTAAAVYAHAQESASKAGSALLYVPSLGREVWIASDTAEADQLRRDLAAEGNDRPVIIAADVVKLQGEPPVEVDGAVRALAAFPGARVVYAGPIKEREIAVQADKTTRRRSRLLGPLRDCSQGSRGVPGTPR